MFWCGIFIFLLNTKNIEAIEKNKNFYEEVLDKTTKSIEEFIDNVESNKEKNIQ